MNKAVISLVGLCVLFALCDVVMSSCEPMACAAIQHPDVCRAVTFYVDANSKGQACQGCDACIQPDDLVNGCRAQACTLQMIPDNCRRERYYVLNGKMCQDCPEDTCKN